MERNRWIVRIVCTLSILVLMLSYSGTLSVQAQDPLPPCNGRDCPTAPGMTSEAVATLKYYTKVTQKGFYVASGVALANLGTGIITSPTLPTGSIVTKAYLFWGMIGTKTEPGFNYAKGIFNWHAITGTLVGTTRPSDWYGPDNKFYAYRADVTAYVTHTGGGSYPLTGFASGATNGIDPWNISPYTNIDYPLLDGASLVVIFSNPNYPTATIQIYNGASFLNSATKSHLTITGVNASVPSGLATTTFIAGEGTIGSPAATTFFETALPTITLTGLDHNGNDNDYSNGNFWDTQTIDLHSLVNPPETNFDFTVTRPAWTGIWVAQVLAYSSGAQDTDKDGLPDGWELNGFDANGDNYVDVPLNSMGSNSASMWHKDLYIEADYMNSGGNFLPPKAQLDDIVATFNAAPVSNPDGTGGIHIHIDTGGADANNPAVTYGAYNMGGGGQIPLTNILGIMQDNIKCLSYNWNDFQGYKNTYFNSTRTPIFHYVIFANSLPACLGGSSGISRNGWPDSTFVKGAMDFIVSLGNWPSSGTAAEREGTFVHELGHNMGLRHGGNDHINFKPNYLSVMNYFFQASGVWHDAAAHFDYSGFLLPTLNEYSLKEVSGLGSLTVANAYGTKWVCPDHTTIPYVYATGGLDWNCNGSVQTSAVKVDLNNDGKYISLGSQNNWASITFKGGGTIGNALAAGGITAQGLPITYWVDELKADQVPPAPPNAPAAK